MNLPLPPHVPLTDPVWMAVAGGAFVVALALLIWGWRISRYFLALVGAAVGAAVGPAITSAVGVEVVPWVAMAVCGGTLALLATVLARAIWAALAAGVLGGVAELIILNAHWSELAQPPAMPSPTTDPLLYLLGLKDFLLSATQTLWNEKAVVLLLALAPPVALVGVLLLIRDRLGRIVMTAWLGSVTAVVVVFLAAGTVNPGVWPVTWMHAVIPLVIIGLMMAVAIALQYSSAAKAEPHDGEKPADAQEKDQSKKPEKAESKA